MWSNIILTCPFLNFKDVHSTTAHSYSAKVCSFVQFCLLSFSVMTARRYYMICIYSVNTVLLVCFCFSL